MRPTPNAALSAFGTTIFAEMSALAAASGAINLGQGFPDEDGPAILLDEASRALHSGVNQYPPIAGDPGLRAAIAAHQRRFYGLEVDPDAEVLVTFGATEALSATMLALCGAGDEVVMFEPYYDAYAAAVALAGGVRRTSALRFPDFALDEASLRDAVTARTRILLLNSPHNPTGTVFSPAELEVVARVAVEHDLLVVTDEVYEHLTFDGATHVPLATLPGMAERTLTISSAGKTFAATGWKVGWISGPADLVAAVRTVKQYLTFSGAAPLQPAVAAGLGLPDRVFAAYADDLRRKRDLLCDALAAAGTTVSRPAGTYFVVADAADLGADDAAAFCRELPDRCGVVGVPVSAFCDSPGFETLVRFAFCKRDDVLVEAARRLAGLRRSPRAG
ncbi:pyridoxal phosphate-dependent aminotransferase [Agilicoccus flavus]|uniref:pyridoxal phosphate-dependent aminotransferase n=1 Tax=Agilicoccus flavus TaxID=2775968 RepID=UPI001CF69ADD|nr:pyridoxal phosphate-dependent aminotransferase [Agilicoccus flavus]